MPLDVVVGTNGSVASRRAIDWAATVALLLDARLLIVLVVDQAEWWQLPDQDAAMLRRTRTSLLSASPGLHVETRLMAGDPSVRLLEAAGEAALLVVGSDRGTRTFGSASFGTVPARVAAGARCPVAIVPLRRAARDRAGSASAGGVVAGIADDAQAESILSLAIDVAGWSGEELIVVHVVTPPRDTFFRADRTGSPVDEPGVVSGIITRAHQHRTDLSADIELRVQVRDGDPTRLLIAAAKGADALVIGTSGRSTRSAFLLGTVCRDVLSAMPCPVLIVPRGSDTPRLTPTRPVHRSITKGSAA